MHDLNIHNIKYNMYKIYEDGRVWSNFLGDFLKTDITERGYKRVRLRTNNSETKTFMIHNLLMEIFKPVDNMENLYVNHIDGNKLNNDLDNLEWVTHQQNIQHSFGIGLNHGHYGTTNAMNIHSEEFIKNIITMLLDGKTNREIEVLTGYSAKEVSKIRHKYRWTYLTKDLTFPKVKRKVIKGVEASGK